MSARELIETALHVLTAWNGGRQPHPIDVKSLTIAVPSLAQLAEDELACRVINDLVGTFLIESTGEVEPHSAAERNVA